MSYVLYAFPVVTDSNATSCRNPHGSWRAAEGTAPGSSDRFASLPHCLLLSPPVRLALIIGPSCPVSVSYVGYVCLSVPSPCERRYRLRVVWTDPTPCRLRLSYLVFRSAYLSPIGDWAHVPAQERTGSPKPALSEVEGFLRLLSTPTPLSGGLRQTLQNLACCSDSLVWASRPLTRSPSALEAPEGAP